MAKNWIAGAIKHPGALTKKAKKAGQSPMAFANAHDTGNSTTAKQSRLAETLQGFHSHTPKGATLSPMGDIGNRRGKEAKAFGGKLGGKAMKPSKHFS